jgi:hypothetical protein
MSESTLERITGSRGIFQGHDVDGIKYRDRAKQVWRIRSFGPDGVEHAYFVDADKFYAYLPDPRMEAFSIPEITSGPLVNDVPSEMRAAILEALAGWN